MTDRWGSLVGKDILVKIIGSEYPIKTQINNVEDCGFWILDDSLRITLVCLTPFKGEARGLDSSPLLFLPLSRIEWFLVDAKEIR